MTAREKEMPGAVGAANWADVDSSQATIVGHAAANLNPGFAAGIARVACAREGHGEYPAEAHRFQVGGAQ